jgi:hypothetical protein
MCIHKYYIFLACGHSLFDPEPLILCPSSPSTPLPRYLSHSPVRRPSIFPPCTPTAHPFRTYALHIPCLSCLALRAQGLNAASACTVDVVVPEARWRATYGGYLAERDAWRTWGAGETGLGGGALRREDVLRRRVRWENERERRIEEERMRRRNTMTKSLVATGEMI